MVNKYNYDYNRFSSHQCHCGTNIRYSMDTIMGLFDQDYIECPYCNTTHWVDINQFKKN